MADAPRKVELGFQGGQVIAVRIAQSALDGLREALGGEGWHRLTTEEDEIDVNLDELIFVRAAGDHQKVGF